MLVVVVDAVVVVCNPLIGCNCCCCWACSCCCGSIVTVVVVLVVVVRVGVVASMWCS